jgi:dihydroxyacetone kinase
VSYLVNDPAAFTDEMITGFVAANRDFVRRVDGGVVRATRTPPGQVAVITGGGSGHYPAFGGLVGQGLAHGAAMGNVFASPSAQQVFTVAKAAASDAGVLLTYGNYAGDVLNFDQAQERLIAAGIPCRTVTVTDDICSADSSETHKRRGIAGALAVFRAAAWAAEQGRTLDQVWQLANAANQRVRSLGVAFSGCKLPGADRPLFTVPPGKMAVGVGIHGEPGIEEQALPTARELGQMLVDRLLANCPPTVGGGPGSRIGVILNGLGSVKYEELFVTYATIAERLDEAGLVIVQPEIGELVTSFEMAGVSLSLFWLDDDLEQSWTSAAATPAYRRGAVPQADRWNEADDVAASNVEQSTVSVASDASKACAPRVLAAIEAVKATVDAHVDELGRMDAVAGDGDHGIGMQRGATAALAAASAAVRSGAGAGGTLMAAGEAWADKGGGTSGALWGLGLRAVASCIGDVDVVNAGAIARGIAEAAQAIVRVGKAQPGDKTMLDALIPFSQDLTAGVEAGAPLSLAWSAAAAVATREASATADLMPRIGRARPHAAKSIGTPDPGAISLALAVTAVAAILKIGNEGCP